MYNVLTLKGSPLVADTSEGVVQRLVARLGAWSANETVDRKDLMALADPHDLDRFAALVSHAGVFDLLVQGFHLRGANTPQLSSSHISPNTPRSVACQLKSSRLALVRPLWEGRNARQGVSLAPLEHNPI